MIHTVTVSGLPGKMAALLANRLTATKLTEGNQFHLVADSMTGPEITQELFTTQSKRNIKLFPGVVPPVFTYQAPEDSGIGRLLAMDATVFSAVNDNAEKYCEHHIPFVMLTTGGDREKLVRTVEQSDIPAVISPNMSVPIIILMSMLEWAAKTYLDFPLLDYELTTDESHQAGKKDKSGTAIAIGKIFKRLGVKHTEEADIHAIRDPREQRAMGIPESALGGHAYHSYVITPPNGNLTLMFGHNIIGRETYVDGAMMALEFLAKKVEEGVKGKVFTMEDVLKG